MIEPIARILIELRDPQPRIWRRADVPASSTLIALHEIIQVAMGWSDAHLFEFRIGDKVYGEPDPDDILYERKVYRAKGLRLKSLIDRGVDRFEYVYDFGDNWIHDIIIEGVRDGEADVDYPAGTASWSFSKPCLTLGMKGMTGCWDGTESRSIRSISMKNTCAGF